MAGKPSALLERVELIVEGVFDPRGECDGLMWKGTKYAHLMVPTAAMPKPVAGIKPRHLSSFGDSATVGNRLPVPGLPECGAWRRDEGSAPVQSLAVGGVESPGSVFLSELDARPNWWTRSVRLPFRMRTDARLTSPIAPPSSTSSPADLDRPIF